MMSVGLNSRIDVQKRALLGGLITLCFPLHVRIVKYAVNLEPLLIGNSPVPAHPVSACRYTYPARYTRYKHYTFDQDGSFLSAS
jgi:hypothetical protein